MARKKRRKYTPEFRAEAVALVIEGGVTQSQVARDLHSRLGRPGGQYAAYEV